LGTDEQPLVMRRSISYAQNRGCVIVAAAGNSNSNVNSVFPASFGPVYSVAATDFNDKKATFSNYGQTISVSAPGVNLVSAFPGGFYASWSGTSFAAPLVSAESALLLSSKTTNSNTAQRLISQSAVIIETTSPHLLGSGRIAPLCAFSSKH